MKRKYEEEKLCLKCQKCVNNKRWNLIETNRFLMCLWQQLLPNWFQVNSPSESPSFIPNSSLSQPVDHSKGAANQRKPSVIELNFNSELRYFTSLLLYQWKNPKQYSTWTNKSPQLKSRNSISTSIGFCRICGRTDGKKDNLCCQNPSSFKMSTLSRKLPKDQTFSNEIIFSFCFQQTN